jgi:hypothetical protein
VLDLDCCWLKLAPWAWQTGAVWLRSWCSRAAVGDASQLDDSVAMAVARIIMAAKGGDEAAAHLYDLFGDTAIEAIGEILDIRCAPAPSWYLHLASL